ncbi:MAG: S1C family serine protease, partial [Candidatus Theseobacter exili]|nr:S1C family serine protease [Candidatus Theseobacter exili]
MKKIISVSQVIFLGFFAFNAVSEPLTESNDRELASKIERNYGRWVLTVNAYSRIDRDIPLNANKNTKKANLQLNVGTAFPIDQQGHLITIHSIVENAEKVQVITSSGEKINAQMLGCDFTGKISVLKIDSSFLPPLPNITPCNNIRPGNKVFFLGVIPGMSVAVTPGLIAEMRISDGTIVVTAIGNPGTSGTPVFDREENLLGLLAFQIKSDNETSFQTSQEESNEKSTYLVLSFEHASVLAQTIINNNEAKCGWLGLYIDLQTSNKEGVLISKVIDGSPAYKAGLKPNDIITEF